MSVVLLFLAWGVGGFVAAALFPESAMVNKMETLASKCGGSIAIVVAAAVLRRYVVRSLGAAAISLGLTEVIVLLIVLQFTGLWSDIIFNVEWLYTLTWNVVIAFLFGLVIGALWDRRAAKSNPTRLVYG